MKGADRESVSEYCMSDVGCLGRMLKVLDRPGLG